jgi:hypothetical protein
MAKTREKRSKQVDEVNYIPLMIERFGPLHAAKLLGFLALWGLSGCPKLPDLARRNRFGLRKSVVYSNFVELREWGVWCRDVKGMENIDPNIDQALLMAQLGLRALQRVSASEKLDTAPVAVVA